MQPHKAASDSARMQAALADYVRDPSLPPPPGIPPERLAVYVRLVRNNAKSFLDLCFSDSSGFAEPQLWQRLQTRFLAEARPQSPFFNDIPAAFLDYVRQKEGEDRLPDAVLEIMDFETALLHAETAQVPSADGIWQEDRLMGLSPAAKLKAYENDFVSSGLETYEASPCHVLVWRSLQDEVFYRLVDGADLLLLQHFSEQNDSFASLSAALRELTGEDADGWLRGAFDKWTEAGVLLPVQY